MNLLRPHKSNICAVIVTYHPDNKFSERVSLILPQLDHVIVVDNSLDKSVQQALQDIKSHSKISLISNGANLGVATALNIGIQWAQEHSYQWVLTLDQDTIPEDFMVNTLIQTYEMQRCKKEIAIIGPNYIDTNTHKIRHRPRSVANRSWIEKKTVITSGGLMSLTAFAQIGPFRDEFFIDTVDHEYCLRARSKGYKLILVLKPLMKHSIGKMELCCFPGLPWIKRYTFNHPPFRCYFIVRNNLIVIYEYLVKDPIWAFCRLFSLLGKIGVICLFEKHRLEKVKFILLGIYDGLTFNTRRNIIIPHG